MAELPEIRLGTKLINLVAVGDKLSGWNDIGIVLPVNQTIQNFVTAAGITNPSDISALNSLYVNLDADGLISKMDVIYPFIGGNETAHSYNLLDTGSFTLSFNGTWVHNGNGITSDGSTAYANTQFQPNVHATGFTSSGSLGMYSLTTGSQQYDMGSKASTGPGTRQQTAMIIKYSDNEYKPGTPVGAISYADDNLDGSGLYIASVTGTTTKGSIDGQIIHTTGSGTYTNSDRQIYIGAFNGDSIGDYSARTYAFTFIGKGLTDEDHSNLYTTIQTYQTALGREVTKDYFLPSDTRLVYLNAEDVNSYPTSGSNWTDLEGNHNVVLQGTFSYGSTPQGNIDFDGSSGKGTFSSQISLDEFTISTWFRMDGASLNTVLGDNDSSQLAQPKILFFADGDVQFRAVQDSTSVRMDVGFDTGSMLSQWHMLTVKRDASNNVFAQLDNGTWVTGSSTVSGTFTIEEIADNGNDNQNFDGAISNMLIYSSSLSDSEVSQIYNYFNPNF